jgi:hypothetical protein
LQKRLRLDPGLLQGRRGLGIGFRAGCGGLLPGFHQRLFRLFLGFQDLIDYFLHIRPIVKEFIP